MPEQAAVFIDGGYLDKVLLHEHGQARIAHDRLAARLARGIPIYRTYFYYCPMRLGSTPTPEERKRQQAQDRFFDKLRSFERFEVRLGRLHAAGVDPTGKPVFVQKQVDILLGLDFARVVERKNATHVVLVGGDGDFVPLIRAAKDGGLITVLAHGQGSTPYTSYSKELWRECDERLVLDFALVSACSRQP